MATGLTKTQLVRHMAEKLALTNKQVAAFFDLQAETAVKETKKNAYSSFPGWAAWSRRSARLAWAATRRRVNRSRSRRKRS